MSRRSAPVRAALAALALAASGCGGGGATPPQAHVGSTVPTSVRLAGVGDSLTAGEQSGGLFGLKGGIVNPIPGSFFPLLPLPVPFAAIPPTQGNGFWALLWSQANAGADPLDAALSPLPLINAPLLGMLAPSTITGPLGGAPTAFMTPCSGANALAYSASTALQTRVNPQTTPFDVAIPGQTLHEALFQIAPTTTCGATIDPTNPNVGLASIVNAESATFYPILGTFGSGITQVQAAVALRAQVVTVWLGSNDLLKYAFSGGAIAATDPGAFSTDIIAVIRQLQASGAKVAVANLIDVLDAGYFTSATELRALLAQLGVPAAVQPYYLGLVPAGGYLTLSGFFKTLASIEGLGPSGPPPVTLTASDTVSGPFAASIQSFNDQYNAQIAAAAGATGATLVDLHGTFKAIATGGGYPANPPRCCSTIFGGGLTSLDGVHPSNTAYAIIANTFISAIDRAFSLAIPPVNIGAIYATDPFAPH